MSVNSSAPSLRRLGLVAALALAFLAAGVGAAPRPAQAPGAQPGAAGRVTEPGYVPLADPESSAVRLGRRTSAPLVSTPLRGGARRLDGLGRAICGALHASSRDSLLRLCVTDAEFRDILWREFPQSRPVTGLQWEDAWRILFARLHSGCGQAVDELGGHAYEFVRFEVDSVQQFRNFRMHSRITLVAKSDEGEVVRWRWLRGVVERKGVFKIYSTAD